MKYCLLILVIIGLGAPLPSNARRLNEQDCSKKAGSIETFWTWFSSNQQRFAGFRQQPGKYLKEILGQAKKIAPGLFIELEPPANGVINLTISADGDKNLFPIVQRIIAKAPTIKGWHFFAFRQRMTIAQLNKMTITVGDKTVSTQQMKFYPTSSGEELDIIVYVEGLTGENYLQVAYKGLGLLDNLLGEYDCVMKVRNYDFHAMPATAQELKGLLPLLDIAAYVDQFHQSKKH